MENLIYVFRWFVVTRVSLTDKKLEGLTVVDYILCLLICMFVTYSFDECVVLDLMM